MKFRFTLTHRGSELGPFAVPALSLWDTQVGAGREWSPGPQPSVTVVGTGPFTPDESEYLWVDYAFEIGVEYSITASYTKVYLGGISNPRSIDLSILDNSFGVIFTENGTTPPSPGGTGSVTLAFTGTSSCRKIAIKVSDGSNVTFVINQVSGASVDPNNVTETLEINEPDGWRDAILKLARDKDFRSLIEFFDGSFIFYGDNGVVNGGIEFIKRYDQLYGPDANLEMLIELTLNDVDYETVFNGQLDLSLAEEMMDNKIRVPIIRDNFWAKFYNRRDTPVNLHATVDLDGNAVSGPVDSIELVLEGQPINYYGEYKWLYSKTYDPTSVLSDKIYLTLNWDDKIKDDIKIFSTARGVTEGEIAKILGNFEAPYDGEFALDVGITISRYDSNLGAWSHKGTLAGFDTFPVLDFYKANNSARLRRYIVGTPGVSIVDDGTNKALRFEVTPTFSLLRGEQITILVVWTGAEPVTLDPLEITIFGNIQLNWKTDVDLVSQGATLVLTGEQILDGQLTSSSRVLVKDQANKWENGIYITGVPWTRATDMNDASEFTRAIVFVTGGDAGANSSWRQTEELGTVGSDVNNWVIADPSDERTLPFDAIYPNDNHLNIVATTRFKPTRHPASLIHDAGAAILKSYGLGEDNPFYSELLGSSFTLARQYDNDGCAWRYAILRGLQLRGYSLADKPFFTSFNEWWKGANPILNLGLTYEVIPGTTVDPEELDVQDLPDWANAGGPFPGVSWNYAFFSFPFVSVNGNGGLEGYTCGLWPAVAGVPYVLTTVVEIFETGTNPTNITFTWAILDAGFNELATEEFTYLSDGFKQETFIITSPTNGVYLGVKIKNDTPSDTKSLIIRLAESSSVDQLLSNEEFSSSADWTNEGSGTSWTFGSDKVQLSLASGLSKELTQEFIGGIGEFHFISEHTSSNVGGGEQMNVVFNFLDSGDNVISTFTYPVVTNNVRPMNHQFTSIVEIVKIQIIAEIISGSDIDFEMPYAALFLIVPTENIVVPDAQVIRVEEVEHFYNPEPSLLISNIRNISRKYDNDKIYNKINIGYNTWRSEDIQGIDDTQTQHIYATKFEKVGQTITLWSEFIAASLSIESTRRKTIQESTDYKFDDSTFIIAINPDDVSPDTYSPELAENFSDIENLLNPELRYNTRITPARNFLRWRKWFNGCLQNLLNSYYKFVRGEGNYDMISTMNSSSPDCLDESYDNMPLSEKQDIEVTNEFIHLPNYYEFEVPLDWEDYKTIRDNRKNAIGISLSDTGHIALFIDQLDYNIMHGFAKITGWTNEYLNIAVQEDFAAEQVCLPATACEDAITDDDDNMLFTEFGACITAS